MVPEEACKLDLIGNGLCDWQIQNNPHAPCDYDRKDCTESLECLELPTLLQAKDEGDGEDGQCTKVYIFHRCLLYIA